MPHRKVWWTHMEKLVSRILDAQAEIRLVRAKASKRLGSDQLESNNSNNHAERPSNIELGMKMIQTILKRKDHQGIVDFSVMNMCKHVPSQSKNSSKVNTTS